MTASPLRRAVPAFRTQLDARWARLLGPRRLAEREMRRRVGNPRTFGEKLRYKMIHDRRPLLTTLADKYAVRGFVADHLGPDLFPPLLWVGRRANCVPWAALPREYAIKVNHGSGGIILVDEQADPSYELPAVGSKVGWVRLMVHPDAADPARMADLLRHWLTLDYSWREGLRFVEPCYRGIKRRILVEELLRDESGELPAVLRFWVLHGELMMIRRGPVATKITAEGTQLFDAHGDALGMSADWQPVPFSTKALDGAGRLPVPEVVPPPPKQLARMVEAAQTIGRAVGDFIRVDFFDLGERFLISELTNYPKAGKVKISPGYYDAYFASRWHQDY